MAATCQYRLNFVLLGDLCIFVSDYYHHVDNNCQINRIKALYMAPTAERVVVRSRTADSLSSFAAGSCVPGVTPAVEALRAHPFPIQLNGLHMYGSTIGASDKSFVSLVGRIWNSLKPNSNAFDFILALNRYNWSTVRFVVEFMVPYSDYFLHSV